MANQSDTNLALASVYADAMLTLAEEQGHADDLQEELRELLAYMGRDEAFANFLSSPTIDAKAREASIEKMLRGRASDLLVDSLQVLNRKERLAILSSVIEAYRLAHEKLRGQVDVHVRTAVPLTDALRDRLQKVASERAGREAVLVEEVDESILGGVVIRIEDEKIDASVASRLRLLGESIFERASTEVHGKRSYVQAG